MDNAFRLLVDRFQNIDVPHDAVGFRQDGYAVTVSLYERKALSGDLQLFFEMKVWVAHSSRADHAPFPPSFQLVLQYPGGIAFYFDILKIVFHVIAFAAAVAIDAAVGAAAIYVDPVRWGQDGFVIRIMHFHFIGFGKRLRILGIVLQCRNTVSCRNRSLLGWDVYRMCVVSRVYCAYVLRVIVPPKLHTLRYKTYA